MRERSQLPRACHACPEPQLDANDELSCTPATCYTPDVRFEVSELSVGRGDAPLLRGLSFCLAEGARVALTGPSGIGKTSALRAIAALDPSWSGSLALDGQSPEAMGAPRWRRRVMWLPQRAVFFGGSVASELARAFGYAASEGAKLDLDAARAQLAQLGLEGVLERRVEELSEGERQRVALVRALVLEPQVLLLDEPTSALDARSRDAVEVALRGRALVVVTHDDAWREKLDAAPVDLQALR